MYLAYPLIAPDNTAQLMAMGGSFEKGARMLSDIGYRHVELLVRDAQALRQTDYHSILNKHQLEVAALSTAPVSKQDGLTLLDVDPNRSEVALNRLMDIIDLAAEHHCPVLIGKFRGNIGGSGKLGLKKLGVFITKACKAAQVYDIDVLLEPQNESNIDNINSIQQYLDFEEMVGCPNLGIHIDTFHMSYSDSDLFDLQMKCANKVGFVHVADTNRQQPGRGDIDIRKIVQILIAMNYGGCFSPEIAQTPNSAVAAETFYKSMGQLLQE